MRNLIASLILLSFTGIAAASECQKSEIISIQDEHTVVQVKGGTKWTPIVWVTLHRMADWRTGDKIWFCPEYVTATIKNIKRRKELVFEKVQ